MRKYHFEIYARLPDSDDDPERYLDALHKSGCSDALVGVGRVGAVALAFARDAGTMQDAIDTAMHEVQTALPDGTSVWSSFCPRSDVSI